jgi:hypothetical protein
VSFAEAIAARAATRTIVVGAPARPPHAIEHVWRWFLDLSARRQAGLAANPISYAELQAWATMTQTLIEPWEARLIMRVDDATLAAMRKKPDKKPMTVATDGPSVVAIMRSFSKPRKRTDGHR